jgi:2-dehydro-3-deoxyphosphooctonate aldolase (KDO 8-P synthase)
MAKPMVRLDNDLLLGGGRLFFVAGPCVIESESLVLDVAGELAELAKTHDLPLLFKSSFDKANRSSLGSFRGPGIEKGLAILARVKKETGLPVLSDIHDIAQVETAGSILDVLQIPAFLSRQTDLLLAAGRSGVAVNIKKGQFLAPWDMIHAVEKVRSTGNTRILLTERGSSFGYNNLVTDMRSIPLLARTGCPVIFDATHSAQLPGGEGDRSGGMAEMIPVLALAAVAAGCHGVFLEVHPNPTKALCDGPNSLRLTLFSELACRLRDVHVAAGHA